LFRFLRSVWPTEKKIWFSISFLCE
jgi:hypothetical protein